MVYYYLDALYYKISILLKPLELLKIMRYIKYQLLLLPKSFNEVGPIICDWFHHFPFNLPLGMDLLNPWSNSVKGMGAFKPSAG